MAGKNLADGTLKAMILQAVLDEKHSSHTIYQAIEYENYNSFLVTMNRMVRYGLLKKVGRGICNTKPFKYSLTKKGTMHAHNPLLNLQHRENYIQKRAMEFMENTEQFRQAVADYAQAHYAGTGGFGGAGGMMPQTNIIPDNSMHEEEQRHEHGIITHKEVKLTENQIKAKERHKRRLPIVADYVGKYLDAQFFKDWRGIYPYLMKGKTFEGGVPGCVEIFSISNPEVTVRRHTKNRLTAEQIYQSKFKIVNTIKKDGKIITLVIDGRGMKKPYLMKV